jgi:hypothetical protein
VLLFRQEMDVRKGILSLEYGVPRVAGIKGEER